MPPTYPGFDFAQQPSDTTAGAAIKPAVTVAFEDAFGNVIDTSNQRITIAIRSGSGEFEDASTLQVDPANGVATFTNLILNETGVYTISATTIGVSEAVSDSFVVSAGPASQLVFVQQPPDALAGTALNPGVTVAVEDRFGNVVTDDTSTLTLKIGDGPGTFEGGNTFQQTTVQGMATFANLKLDVAGTYTLAATEAFCSRRLRKNSPSTRRLHSLVFLAVPTSVTAGPRSTHPSPWPSKIPLAMLSTPAHRR